MCLFIKYFLDRLSLCFAGGQGHHLLFGAWFSFDGIQEEHYPNGTHCQWLLVGAQERFLVEACAAQLKAIDLFILFLFTFK